MDLIEAICIVKAAGYRVSKPKAKIVDMSGKLNAVGKPYSPHFDPNYRIKHRVSYAHLRKPMPPNTPWVP